MNDPIKRGQNKRVWFAERENYRLKGKKVLLAAVLMGLTLTACTTKSNNELNELNELNSMNTTLNLTQEWDKTFPKSDKVDHKKVTFKNRYGIELAADMYIPISGLGDSSSSRLGTSLNDQTTNSQTTKYPAIAVTGPFGAVKEQTSGLYAQHMAERGFLTIAFDPSFTGESGGEPRRMASPDINTEDFLAAVDFLSNQENVDAERIGIIGICGFGGMAVNAAALDPRIKATVASTMYDMSKVNSDILTAFHQQLREYFVSGHPERRSAEGRLLPTGRKNGLPTVAYFADKACLSPNYFGDLISKESGTTAK